MFKHKMYLMAPAYTISRLRVNFKTLKRNSWILLWKGDTPASTLL